MFGVGFTDHIYFQGIDAAMRVFWKKGLADSTNKTITSEINTYLVFCYHFELVPIPVSSRNACLYVTTLASTHTYQSIKRYVSALGHLHRGRGLAWNLPLDYNLYRVLQGIKRTKGGASFSKLHITPIILRAIYAKLNLEVGEDLAFWAACLLAFYSFFRKSNVVPPTESTFDRSKHLCAEDIRFNSLGVLIQVRWSKTIQFADRLLEIPIANVDPDFLSFPKIWNRHLANLGANFSGAAFTFRSAGKWKIGAHKWFVDKLRLHLTQAGFDAKNFSGHSFRSGGATFAFECGVPAPLIKLQGDWLSDAYLRYVRIGWDQKWAATLTMASKVGQVALGPVDFGRS